ncbi:MAG: tail protein X [Eubacteriales bacterium]|nr:tail protein X [Eubacteriales bacterium]
MTLSGRTHKCAAGETWDIIALREYGHEKYTSDLLNANPELCLIMEFKGGEVLKLPVLYIPSDEDDMNVIMTDVAPWKER